MNLYEDTIQFILSSDSNFKEILDLAVNLDNGNFFIAGGAVRDTLLKRKQLKDADLFVSQFAFQLLEQTLLSTGQLIVNPFGSARWYPSKGQAFYYDIIVIEKFFNGLWKCHSIIDALNQFDITANAMALDVRSMEFYNPQNGLSHLHQKTLRAIRFDFPEINVSEKIPISRNSVLWFRYNYYAKTLGFEIEEITQKWIDKNSYRSKDKDVFKKYFFDPGHND